jgi:D-tyrosyl-tRNA(Tyr) deacylase
MIVPQRAYRMRRFRPTQLNTLRGRIKRMRAVVQRVSRARVTVDGRVTGEIGAGLVVLVAVGREDSATVPAAMADKIANLRIFNDEQGKMNRSLLDSGGAVLVVSQFTLYGDARGQRRPSFIQAAPPDQGKAGYEEFVRALKSHNVRVETGEFQAHMSLELTNDGPVTILLDSDRTF